MTTLQKTIISVSTLVVIATAFVGCGSTTPKVEKKAEGDFRCHQENVLAPKWTCTPFVENGYAGLGIAQKSAAGMDMMRRIALANGRSDLAQQIQTQVKDKVEAFTRTTGVADSETVDKVATSVTKQLAKVNLSGSKAVNSWTAPSGALYLLVSIPNKAVNSAVKNSVKTSFKNNQALWQQFQSKKALESLDAEFPTE